MKSPRLVVLPGVLLFAFAALAGCEMFSGDAWQRPSLLTSTPPPQELPEKREIRGGFAVAVNLPGQPTAERAAADIGEFAGRQGFARQGAEAAPARYVLGKIILDVTYDAPHLRVNAYLHSTGPGHDREFIEGFYRGFQREYAGRYGDEGTIVESDFTDGQARAPRESAGRGSAGGSRGGR